VTGAAKSIEYILMDVSKGKGGIPVGAVVGAEKHCAVGSNTAKAANVELGFVTN